MPCLGLPSRHSQPQLPLPGPNQKHHPLSSSLNQTPTTPKALIAPNNPPPPVKPALSHLPSGTHLQRQNPAARPADKTWKAVGKYLPTRGMEQPSARSPPLPSRSLTSRYGTSRQVPASPEPVPNEARARQNGARHTHQHTAQPYRGDIGSGHGWNGGGGARVTGRG